jgi:uncharacterized protein YecE (DUF72 family)
MDDRLSFIRVGTSGFSYKDWAGSFYPQFCPPADFLQVYANHFDTVEIDATFYRIPDRSTVLRWHKVTPEYFVFAAKFPKAVTHEGTAGERLETMRRFVAAMQPLENKQGPLLMQFPYSFKPEQREMLQRLIEAVPEHLQVAVELRHKGWLEEASVLDLMRKRNMALTLIDHPWMPRHSEMTADFGYVRLLGDRKKIQGDFSYVRDDREEDLRWWAELLDVQSKLGRTVYVYINNHYTGHSPTTAWRLIELLRGSGEPS